MLHFSNGGGVYLGQDKRTDKQVVLKEARPHAGLDATGRDAVAGCRTSATSCERLAGLDVVPELLDYFTARRPPLPGARSSSTAARCSASLSTAIRSRTPILRRDELAATPSGRWACSTASSGRSPRCTSAAWCSVTCTRTTSWSSVDGRMVLIDFEVSTLAEDRVPFHAGPPGFQPPADRQGADVDRYALACLRLHLFAPQTTMLLPMNRAKAAQLGRVVGDVFPVPEQAIDARGGHDPRAAQEGTHVLSTTCRCPARRPWPEIRDALRTAIVASATPERDGPAVPRRHRPVRAGRWHQPRDTARPACSTRSPRPVPDASPSTRTGCCKHAVDPGPTRACRLLRRAARRRVRPRPARPPAGRA